MKNWYAVFTKPRQELLAEDHLRRQGYEIYLPRVSRSVRRRGKWRDAVEVLFPRYLFVNIDIVEHGVASIRSTRGVTCLVRFGQELVPVPGDVVDFLKHRENPQTGLHDLGGGLFGKGDKVRILDGPLAGLEAVFETRSGPDRVLILLDILGRVNRVQVNPNSLAPASPDGPRKRGGYDGFLVPPL